MKRLGTFLLMMTLLPAGNIQAAFLDGSKLLEFCYADGGYREGSCDGYVAGVVDSRLELQDRGMAVNSFCLPDTIDLGQIVQVVINYLATHADELHYTANSSVQVALQQAFPCE